MNATSSFSAAAGQQQFLNLLVTQLQHQDPLSPIDQADFLSQLAQFSTVEQLEQMNSGFENQLQLQLLSSGSSLLGRTITDTAGQSGRVDEVTQNDGQVLIRVGGHLIPLSDVESVTIGADTSQDTSA